MGLEQTFDNNRRSGFIEHIRSCFKRSGYELYSFTFSLLE